MKAPADTVVCCMLFYVQGAAALRSACWHSIQRSSSAVWIDKKRVANFVILVWWILHISSALWTSIQCLLCMIAVLSSQPKTADTTALKQGHEATYLWERLRIGCEGFHLFSDTKQEQYFAARRAGRNVHCPDSWVNNLWAPWANHRWFAILVLESSRQGSLSLGLFHKAMLKGRADLSYSKLVPYVNLDFKISICSINVSVIRMT